MLALVPPAAAEPAVGHLVVRDTLEVPEGSHTRATLLAGLVQGGFSSFQARAPRLHVTVYEESFVHARTPPEVGPSVQYLTGHEARSFWITDATIDQVGEALPQGFVGFYPLEGAPFALEGRDRMAIRPAGEGRFENGGQSSDDIPGQWWYHRTIDAAHLRVEGTGAFAGCGGVAFKVFGSEILIQGKENETAQSVRTGWIYDEPVQGRLVWAYVVSEELCVSGDGRLTLAAAEVPRLAWNGRVAVRAMSGEIRAGDVVYGAKGLRASLDGTLVASLRPTGGDKAAMDLEGDLRGTTLAGVAGASAPLPTGVSQGGWVLVGAAVGAGVTGVVVWGRRRQGPATDEASLDRCLDMAEQAHARGRPRLALDWIREARRHDPASAGLAMEEATTLEGLGHAEEALAAYAEAHELAADGLPALARARLLERTGRPADEVRAWAERALARSPGLVDDLSGGDFARFRADPAWSLMLRDATRRLAGRSA
ncbi:MAG TPA: hypothetical protein VHH36_09555 [Candidatus Thermoplasmatota archaeon]|nr:hypothetical protein [Candidatus Thermoplasmatota archaeon]